MERSARARDRSDRARGGSDRAKDGSNRARDRARGIELGIGLKINNARRTVLARASGLVNITIKFYIIRKPSVLFILFFRYS